MSWKQTYTGKMYWPTNPQPDDVCIEDIAHSLSLMCRFNGSCSEFYSVAQHSVLVSILCSGDPVVSLCALLHDASEAYLSDVPSPVKPHLMGYVDLEAKNMVAVAEAFGLPWPFDASIKTADVRMLATEKRDLMGKEPAPWGTLHLHKPYDMKVVPCSAHEAEQMFLSRFETLTQEISGRAANGQQI